MLFRSEFLSEDDQKMFSAMAFSYEIGTTKPDPKSYEVIADKLGVNPDEVVFIDDQPRYCEGAEAFGMKAVVYKNFPQMKAELEALISPVSDN